MTGDLSLHCQLKGRDTHGRRCQQTLVTGVSKSYSSGFLNKVVKVSAAGAGCFQGQLKLLFCFVCVRETVKRPVRGS